jgi:hypothetical protein
MKKIKTVILVILGLIFLLVAAYFLVGFFRPKVAGIYIESIPAATVYIDGVEVGRTLYEKTQNPGEITIKLVPDSFDIPLVPYETKVNLVAGVQTVIKRVLGENDDASSGEVVSFERIDKNQVSLAVVTIPDSAELLIDGNERAFTPHRTTSLLPGVHTLKLRADGYQEKEVNVRTHVGYKLTAVIKLAKASISENLDESREEIIAEEIDEDEEVYGKVRILSTPTGFLRVRNEPSTLGQEVGTVDPEKIYDLLETDEKTGWYKIKFLQGTSEEEKEGWISNQYAQVVEPLPKTPSITP